MYANQSCSSTFSKIPTTEGQPHYMKKGFYDGLGEVNELTKLGKHLRNSSIDPKKTNIKYLRPFIQKHIHHIQQGLIATHQNHKLDQLNALEKKALEQITNEQITLHWWLLFNIKLAWLATRSSDIFERKLEFEFLDKFKNYKGLTYYIEKNKDDNEVLYLINKALNSFPEKIILPTTSQLGILALNRPSKNGLNIIPVELFNQKKSLDGTTSSPIEAFLHNLKHVIKLDYGVILFPKNPELNRQIVSHIEKLPTIAKKKKAEVIYFILTHELLPEERPTIHQIVNSQDLLRIISSSYSILDPMVIFTEAQILNTLNDQNIDIYSLGNPKKNESDILSYRYNMLIKESINIFTQTARKAFKMHLRTMHF